MKTLDIGLDLDGVCYDFVGALRDYLVDKKGFDPESLPESKSWHFYSKQWGMTTEEYLQYCHDGVDDGILFRFGSPPDRLYHTLRYLQEQGHRVHIVTARSYGPPGKAEENTRKWLWAWDLKHASLTFSHDKTVVPTDIFLEDNADNYQALEAAGTYAVLYDRPWNHHLEGARRVFGLNQFMDHVLDLSLYTD